MLTMVFVGLAIGSVYGLTAMGLVLTYRTSGILNLAHGATGMVGTYVFWQAQGRWGWPIGFALLLSLGVAAPALGVISYAVIFRWVKNRSTAHQLTAAVALMLGLQGLASVVWGTFSVEVPSIFPFHLYKVPGDLVVSSEQLGTIAVTVVTSAAVWWYIQHTRFGLRTRAVVDREFIAELTGEDTTRVHMINWGLAAMIATISGILISTVTLLDPVTLTLIVIQAMAVAVVGRLRSLPVTYVAGLGLGILEAALAKYLPAGAIAQGLKISASFLVLYVVLIAGSYLFGADFIPRPSRLQSDAGGLGHTDATRIGPALVLMGLVVVAVWPATPFQRFLITSAIISAIALLGFVLITGFGGAVVVCQASFQGLAAIGFARMVAEWHWPLAVALIGAPLVAVVAGLMVAVPAARLTGLPLALLTLAFALFIDNFVFKVPEIGGTYAGFKVPRPSMFGLDLSSDIVFAYVCLAVLLVAVFVVRNLASGRSGRVFGAVKYAPLAAAAYGTTIWRVRLPQFMLSSLLAGISGVLIAIQVQSVSAIQFGINQSILLLVIAVLGGIGRLHGPLLAAALLHFGPEFASRMGVSKYLPLIFASGAAIMLLSGRDGLAGLLDRATGFLRRDRVVGDAGLPGQSLVARPELAVGAGSNQRSSPRVADGTELTNGSGAPGRQSTGTPVLTRKGVV
jgi:branched-chain amino acid transport system permease protein